MGYVGHPARVPSVARPRQSRQSERTVDTSGELAGRGRTLKSTRVRVRAARASESSARVSRPIRKERCFSKLDSYKIANQMHD